MASAPDPETTSDPSGISPIPPSIQNPKQAVPPRKRAPRPRSSLKLPRTDTGEEAEETIRAVFAEMLSNAAQVRGHRRRAGELDRTDFEAAFDDIANPRPRPIWLDAIGDFALLVGGILIGVGTNILTGGGNTLAGSLGLIPGIIFGLISIAIKYCKI